MKSLLLLLSLASLSYTASAAPPASGRCNLYSTKVGFEIQVDGKTAYQDESYALTKIIFEYFEDSGICSDVNQFCSFEMKNGEYVVRNKGLSGVISPNFSANIDFFKYLVRSGVCSTPQMRCLFASQGDDFVALHDGQVYARHSNPYRVALWLRDLSERGLCLQEPPVK